MRKAKIVCTLGPASQSPSAIGGLIRAGMDVARLNFSHGTPREHQQRLELVRRLAKKLDRSVAVLQDIQGPKLRVGQILPGVNCRWAPGLRRAPENTVDRENREAPGARI